MVIIGDTSTVQKMGIGMMPVDGVNAGGGGGFDWNNLINQGFRFVGDLFNPAYRQTGPGGVSTTIRYPGGINAPAGAIGTGVPGGGGVAVGGGVGFGNNMGGQFGISNNGLLLIVLGVAAVAMMSGGRR